MNTVDLIGTYGVFLLLLAYFLNLFGYLNHKGKLYSIMNAVGALIAGYASYLLQYWPFVILEATWALVSLGGFIKAMRTTDEA
ncbi:hypothetical protein BH11BAC2_BH11BAC2_25000 [soil metagenome]